MLVTPLDAEGGRCQAQGVRTDSPEGAATALPMHWH